MKPLAHNTSETVDWLTEAIRALPSDAKVPKGTPGYNTYTSQRDHWLGWLDPAARTGTYPRQSGNTRGARGVYNRIVEPKMLLWLARAAGISQQVIEAATIAAGQANSMPSKAAAVRKHVPWEAVAESLKRRKADDAA
jgi:hypothetical protein